ncbi:MAG: SUF system NifU family Fe-S cluster assembly protein [Solobacterium sp.]|nr:SUF system NifU family Fe-S cluster assembly protein [Solobacterium sp.]
MSHQNLLSDPDILRELIMDHYKYPHHHSLTEENGYLQKHMASESCIDDITVQTKIEDGIIQDIRFDGVACTISTASTSMMTDLLIGKTIEEAKAIIDEYFMMIDGKEYDEEVLQEAVAMKNVYKQANRIKYATIGWNAIQALLESEASHE